VGYSDLWGLREGKYKWLRENESSNTEWKTLTPQSPFYLFVPQETGLLEEYNKGWKVTDIMPVNSTGVKTHRDHFVYDFDKAKLKKRIEEFRNLDISDGDIAAEYKLEDTGDWQLRPARQSLANQKDWESHFTKCLYRPFDFREYYHHEDLVDRPRNEVMQHFIPGDNFGLIFMRQVALQDEYSHFLVTRTIVDNRAFYSNKGIMSVAPLYLYPQTELEKRTGPGRRPNLAPGFTKDFSTRLGMKFIPDGKGNLGKGSSRTAPTFGPEDVFDYMYAIFHSPTYRSRYAEFLKMDFPRLPLTSTADLFRGLCAIGAELVALHLLDVGAIHELPLQTRYPIPGDNTVENVRYTEPGQGSEKGRVWINKEQYFKGVPPEVWNFHIGGYQVCQKWLKDRKGRKLTYDDLTHYQCIVAALADTIRLMAEIDRVIEEYGRWPIQ
jgi:predicted helicase